MQKYHIDFCQVTEQSCAFLYGGIPLLHLLPPLEQLHQIVLAHRRSHRPIIWWQQLLTRTPRLPPPRPRRNPHLHWRPPQHQNPRHGLNLHLCFHLRMHEPFNAQPRSLSQRWLQHPTLTLRPHDFVQNNQRSLRDRCTLTDRFWEVPYQGANLFHLLACSLPALVW